MVLGMRKSKPNPPKEVLYGSERSPLFWLLYEHYASLDERWRTNRADWRAVCAWAVSEKAWNRNGAAPSVGTAQKTWYRVKQQKRREAEAQAQIHRKSAARTPRHNTASQVVTPDSTETRTSEPGATQQLGDLWRLIERRSGRYDK